MTAIAIKHGILAVDSLVTVSPCQTEIRDKAMELNGFVWTGTGAVSDTEAFFEFVRKANLDKQQLLLNLYDIEWPKQYDEDGAIIAFDGCDIIEFRKDRHPILTRDIECESFGCHSFLIGAMRAGASAEQAVVLACEHVEGCGGPVGIYDLRGNVT